MKIRLVKQKKLKEMTVEEIKLDQRMYTFMTYLALGLGFAITVLTMMKDADLALGSLGFTFGITSFLLFNVMVDSFELRIREVLEKRA